MREDRHGRSGMRYPETGELMVIDREGRHHVGNYVREDGRWRRSNWNDLGARLAWTLDREYAEMLKPHPFLEMMRKRANG